MQRAVRWAHRADASFAQLAATLAQKSAQPSLNTVHRHARCAASQSTVNLSISGAIQNRLAVFFEYNGASAIQVERENAMWVDSINGVSAIAFKKRPILLEFLPRTSQHEFAG